MRAGLVLLDRDGVINEDSPSYIRAPEDWTPIPGSIEAISALTRAGWEVAICTNQSGIARGLFAPSALAAIHADLRRAVTEAGGQLAGIHVCPHAPDDGCACRKPAPGLLEAAIAERQSDGPIYFVGDSLRDLEAADRAGVIPILVLTGNGQSTLASGTVQITDDRVFPDLAAFAHALTQTPEPEPHDGQACR